LKQVGSSVSGPREGVAFHLAAAEQILHPAMRMVTNP